MTKEEIKNTPELVDFMLDDCVLADSRAKVRKRLEKVCDIAIKALEQEPCEDAISRQAVLDAMYALCDTGGTLKENPWRENPHIDAITDALDNLPSVTPQPKTGRWEWIQYDYNPNLGNWHCSKCRCVVVECVGKEEKGGIPLYKYCPNCGVRMVEPQESEEGNEKQAR